MNRATLNALAVLCMGLSSCASVPLSTMVRMSTLDERTFAALDPDVLRVKVTLPEGFELNTAASWLGVEIASAAGAHNSTFELQEVQVRPVSIPGGFFSASTPGITYELNLAVPSRSDFRELQDFVSKGRIDDMAIRVVPRLSAFPKEAAMVRVWIDLLLSETQGYFTLVDGADLSLETLRARHPER